MSPLVFIGLLASQPALPVPQVCPEAELRALDGAIAELRTELDDVSSATVRRRLRRRLDTVDRAARLLRKASCQSISVPVVPLPPPPPPPPPGYEDDHGHPPPPAQPQLAPILDGPSYRALVGALRAEAFADTRMQLLDAGLSGYCLTVDEANGILSTFTFPDKKLKVVERVLPRIVDREKSVKLFSNFEFSSHKAKLSKLLKSTPNDAACAP